MLLTGIVGIGITCSRLSRKFRILEPPGILFWFGVVLDCHLQSLSLTPSRVEKAEGRARSILVSQPDPLVREEFARFSGFVAVERTRDTKDIAFFSVRICLYSGSRFEKRFSFSVHLHERSFYVSRQLSVCRVGPLTLRHFLLSAIRVEDAFNEAHCSNAFPTQ
jgi:hypothetical protein